ncbi:ATP-binding cassette domain-containing protein [Mesorhizobium delmotii]|uniref:Fused maltose transport subunit, ATP-binding component of ABC superfamily regulatory protein n=1 Tax=Mesorhizobium delmotii TaxID=1631247 RepID=A0A2P9AQZ6_9HYPH
MAELKLRGARKSYGSVEIIKGLDLDVEDREFVVFVGPSGCGKSTLLLLKLKVASAVPEGVTVTLPGGEALTVPVAAGASKSGDDLLLGMRPEHLRISANGQFKVASRAGGAAWQPDHPACRDRA